MQPDRGDATTRGDRVVSRAREVDVSPIQFLDAFDEPVAAWVAPDGPTIVGVGAVRTVTAMGPGRFGTIRREATDVFGTADVDLPRPARPRLLGGFAFHEEHTREAPWTAFPGARFVLPRLQFVEHDGSRWLTASGTARDPAALEAALDDSVARVRGADPVETAPPGVSQTTWTPARDEWLSQVRAALDRIDSGELEKVVVAGALEAALESEVSVAALLSRLGDTYPQCRRFAVKTGDATFVGATPERLVRRRGRQVETEALAGSIGRGADQAADDALATQLRESEKDQHEHRLVVDAVRDQLAPLSEGISIGDRRIRRLATVQHLQTPVEARLAADRHVLSVVDALHPTPAVGGLPPSTALRTIRETETVDRGWYAAPVGWFDAAGDGSFAVGIRSAVVEDQTATLFAGNGIVADSDPSDEWSEMQLKYSPVLDHLRRPATEQ